MPDISGIAKFESDLLKINEDIAPHAKLQNFTNVWMVGDTNLLPNNKKSEIFHFFAELYLCLFWQFY